jgi:hypothetical protein
MSRLEGRLRKLEARLTDGSGLLPHTQGWLDYWTARLDKLINGEPIDVRIPFTVIDVLIGRGDR